MSINAKKVPPRPLKMTLNEVHDNALRQTAALRCRFSFAAILLIQVDRLHLIGKWIFDLLGHNCLFLCPTFGVHFNIGPWRTRWGVLYVHSGCRCAAGWRKDDVRMDEIWQKGLNYIKLF